MSAKVRRALSLFCSIAVFLMVAMCVLSNFVDMPLSKANMDVTGSMCFRYFTYDSNILAAIASLFLLLSELCRKRVSRAALLWKYAGTCAVAVTLVTVLCFLGPRMGYPFLLSGTGFYLHALVPVLSIFSFLLWDGGGSLRGSDLICGILPVGLYAGVYLSLVVLWPTWPDFYGFNLGGKWYVSLVAMIAAAVGIAALLRALRNRITVSKR